MKQILHFTLLHRFSVSSTLLLMAALPTTFDRPVRIAVIGGTGLSKIQGFEPVASVTPITPWGTPSSAIQICLHNDIPVALLARHGVHHQFAPHEVPARANIAALRSLGVRSIIAFSAVGSLQEEIKPMDFCVPDQVIDRTKGIRPFTFFEGGVVGHVGFADPFDAGLAAVVKECASAMVGDGVVMHNTGTIVCMEGPAFSTRAESNMYRAWGGSVINMSVLPEAKLAREAEIAYQMICMATDYDCWHSIEDVNVEMVIKCMTHNGMNARNLIGAVLNKLTREVDGDVVMAKKWEGSVQGAVKFMTKPDGRDPQAMKNIEYLFPGFWEN